jgi:hypothetical protein
VLDGQYVYFRFFHTRNIHFLRGERKNLYYVPVGICGIKEKS